MNAGKSLGTGRNVIISEEFSSDRVPRSDGVTDDACQIISVWSIVTNPHQGN